MSGHDGRENSMNVCQDIYVSLSHHQIRPLTLEEKKYLLAVERGDIANVRRFDIIKESEL